LSKIIDAAILEGFNTFLTSKNR